MYELKSHEIASMKTLYADPSGLYKLVEFNGDSDNLEVILFRKDDNLESVPEMNPEEPSAIPENPLGLTRRCLGFLTDGTGERQKWEIDSEGEWHLLPSGGKGRPPKDFPSRDSFMDYWKTLKIDSSKEGKSSPVKATGPRTGWWRIPCYCTTIESGLFKIIEYCIRDKMGDSIIAAQELRTIFKEFKDDIRKQLGGHIKRPQ